MAPWIPLFLVSNLVYWLVFLYLAVRHRPSGIALNQLFGLMQPGSGNDIQFGEYLTIRGFQALLIMGILLVGGPAFSAGWAARRARKAMA